MTTPVLTGSPLQAEGQKVLDGLGLGAISPLAQAPLRLLDPGGPHGRGDHLEMDYLVPLGEVCLVGEITARKDADELKKKYRTFCRHLGILSNLSMGSPQWLAMGVPANRLKDFEGVKQLVGFFIATEVEEFDVDLDRVDRVAVFLQKDWDLLKVYRDSIGTYARPYFLSRLAGPQPASQTSLTVSHASHGLMRIAARQVASGTIHSAAVYTFAANPYDLLPMASVFRRDLLPDLSTNHGHEYQRPLISEKLDGIRNMLVKTPDFMFPTSILVVLSTRCRFLSSDGGTLLIPGEYGAIEIIDGQHRLFSYAADEVRAIHSTNGRVVVTAIDLGEQDRATRTRASARTFVEVNSTQTRVPRSHVLAISYRVLGDTSPRSLGAEVLLRLNERLGATRCLFSTSQTRLGIIKATTALIAVGPLCDVNRLRKLAGRKGKSGEDARRGSAELLRIADLANIDAAQLIARVEEALAQYLGRVRGTFKYDWPAHVRVGSSLEFAKVFAAVIRLFDSMIREGLDWQTVQDELTKLRANLMKLAGMTSGYRSVLLDQTIAAMPTSGHSVKQDFQFLQANRSTPTSIQKFATKPKRGQPSD